MSTDASRVRLLRIGSIGSFGSIGSIGAVFNEWTFCTATVLNAGSASIGAQH